jgi:hypothetical protein
MILVLRGHIRDSFNNDELFILISTIHRLIPNLEIYIHTWAIKQNNISWRPIIKDETPITNETIKHYFKNLTKLIKHIIIEDDKNIKITGNTKGVINKGHMPVLGWKNYWYGKYQIINYIYMSEANHEKLVVNMRFDVLSGRFPLESTKIIKFIEMQKAIPKETNKFISDTNGYGIDNIYIGSIRTQYKLIKHFHENLDLIIEKNRSTNEQEFIVFKENAKMFSV